MDREIGESDPAETPKKEEPRPAVTPVEPSVVPASSGVAADTAATIGEQKEEPRPATAATGAAEERRDMPAAIDLNEMHKMSPEELVELAKKFGVVFHP